LSENLLLAALPAEERESLLPRMERVPLTLGEVLYDQHERIRHVYFPTSGVVSLLSATDEGMSIEAGTAGAEGMVGVPVFLGVDTSFNKTLVQVAGEALRMKSEAFREAAQHPGSLHDLMLLYVHARMTQMSLSIGCNRFHNVEKRLARWLLMMQDCARTDEFTLTQDIISRMIGAQRPHVTTAANGLHQKGLIQNGRGKVNILNRKGLLKVVCACYTNSKAAFDQLFGV
jgi:CRP-like cAMP-binding protein